MAEDDIYKRMGFMCGIEIHQRLATKRKLFCGCTAEMGTKEHEIGRVRRRQRAVAGELGKVDRSAEFEEERERDFTYKVFSENSCLVDIDEEPPHEMNEEALMITLSVAKAMGMEIVDELQAMRKGVVDGSDPSAFQRTALVAVNGSITVNGKKIAIPTLSLEEESSGIAERGEGSVTYDTDRLGVPLIEIGTAPTISDPRSAKDVALHIGTLLRLTGRVQRGIGSIRQDINMSIKGGARIEMKGVQELALIDKFIENEIIRQQELLKIKEDLVAAHATVGKIIELTSTFKSTKAKILGGAECVMGLGLHGFKGILGREINPKRRLGTEISDYAKMAGVNGLIHSDEDLTKYGISDREEESIRKNLGIEKEGGFIIIAADRYSASKGIELARWRAVHAFEGVPKETRAAITGELCTTRFMRPLPGGARMYPETDVRPITVTDAMIEEAAQNAPNMEKERKYLKSKIANDSIAEQLMLSPKYGLFKQVINSTKADPEFVANFIVQKLTELRRNSYVGELSEKQMIALFKSYGNGEITKAGVEEVAKALLKKEIGVDGAIKDLNLRRVTGDELERLVKAELKRDGQDAVKAIMSKYRLVVDGTELHGIISKFAKK